MALSFAKKKKPLSGNKPNAEDEDKPKSKTPEKKKASSLGFMKRGDAARQALAEEEARAEKAREEAGKMWRFWMPQDEDRKITFLDGDLDDESMLDIPMYHEHGIKVNGQWTNFPCTNESEGYCPLCEEGDKPSLVGVMTIIDHTPHTIKTGPNAGNVIQHSRKLFVAKKQTIRLLSKLAVKRGGLTGCTFDVMRGDKKTAAVGSQFDFDEKNSLEDIAEACDLKLEDVQPADYDAEITYHTSDELVELGLGKAPSGPGYGNKSSGSSDNKDLNDEL